MALSAGVTVKVASKPPPANTHTCAAIRTKMVAFDADQRNSGRKGRDNDGAAQKIDPTRRRPRQGMAWLFMSCVSAT